MGREVRRIPLDWQHPMTWREQWDTHTHTMRTELVPRPLFDDYPAALARWESEGDELAHREGFDWTFSVEYHLTGYQGQGDTEPTIHPLHDPNDQPITVRDADHLHQLLTAQHAASRPNPDDYMPDFPEGTATGWCMYETTSEGTPISPAFETPEDLARWLADTRASAFGGSTATYEQWLRMALAGWAPSAVVTSDGALHSGVEFAAATARQG